MGSRIGMACKDGELSVSEEDICSMAHRVAGGVGRYRDQDLVQYLCLQYIEHGMHEIEPGLAFFRLKRRAIDYLRKDIRRQHYSLESMIENGAI